MEIKEGDLVLVRSLTKYGYSNTWWRVMFIDTDETFLGKLERHHWHEYTEHKIGDIERFNVDKAIRTYIDGEQFCYSDKITICNCVGLCKDK